MFKSPQTENIIRFFMFQPLGLSSFIKFKKFILFLISFSLYCYPMFCQVCGSMEGYNHQGNSFNGLSFYSPKNCTALEIKCNLVVLKRNNPTSTGSFPDNSFVNSMKFSALEKWSKIRNDDQCNFTPNEVYPRDSHVTFDFEIHEIVNTAAWDYNAAAINGGYSSLGTHPFCPGGIDNVNSNWPELKDVVDDFHENHPNDINVFFVENGAKLAYYESYIAQGIDIPDKWENVNPNPGFNAIFDGCARFPIDYFKSQKNFIILTDIYTDYLGTLHFGHIENGTGDPSTNLQQANDRRWSEANLLNHELAHALGVDHYCGCKHFTNSSNASNVPSGQTCMFNGVANYLRPEDLNRIQEVLSTKNLHKFVQCDKLDANNCIIVTKSNETVTEPMSVFGDLIVKSGHTLTLRDEVFLSEESSIDVEAGGKLIIDGALLTTGCEFDTWKGIRAAGGNTDFDVMTMNGAVIENTSEAAISMVLPSINGTPIQQSGNGILLADNTTFRNCERMAELMAFSPSSNNSRITNCIQWHGEYGVTNSQCEGVLVQDCAFFGPRKNCIELTDGSYDLINNEFFGTGEVEVLFANTSSGTKSTLESNTFRTADIGFHALGTHVGEVQVEGNTFFNPAIGILMDNLNDYSIENNLFTSSGTGIVCAQNGIKIFNNISRNVFTGNKEGIRTFLRNDGLTFLNNCFDCSSIDIELNSGTMAPRIGDGAPAGNCFTHRGAFNHPVYDIGGTPIPLPNSNSDFKYLYFETEDTVDDCFDGLKSDPEIIDRPKVQGAADDSFCIPDNSEDPQTPEHPDDPHTPTPCNPESTIEGFTTAIEDLNVQIEDVNVSDRTQEEKDILTSQPKRCLSRAQGNLYSLYVENKNYDLAREIFQPAENFEEHIAVYSTFLGNKEYLSASQYLNDLIPESNAEQDYIFTQHLNIQRLINEHGTPIEEGDLGRLVNIVEDNHIYSGISKSLYYILTGILLPFENTTESDLPLIDERSELIKTEFSQVLDLFPNPFENVLNVKIRGFEDLQIQVYNLNGQSIYRKNNLSNDITLTTETWIEGVYIINLTKDGEILRKEKFVLIR